MDELVVNQASVPPKRLRLWHTAAAVFMTIQVIALSVIPLEVKFPQTVGFPIRIDDGGPMGTPNVKESYKLGGRVLIVVFVALAALDHIIVSFYAWFRPQVFEQYIYVKKQNPLRWIEYSFSASIMTVLLGTLAGVYDVHTSFLVAVLTGICNILGIAIEAMPKDPETRRGVPLFLYWVASIALIASILPQLCYFFSNVENIPGFVYAAYLLTFVCYLGFALNFYFYYFLDWYDFSRSEVIYVILSFTAKTFLAWDVFGGFKAAESS